MNKQTKNAIIIIVSTIIIISFGALLLSNKNSNQTISNPITPIPPKEQNEQTCDTNHKCFLTNTKLHCSACDLADDSWQCLDQKKKSEIDKKYQEFMNSEKAPLCAICMAEDSPLLFRCVCANGNCQKTANCATDDDCSGSLLYTRGGTYKCIDKQCKYTDNSDLNQASSKCENLGGKSTYIEECDGSKSEWCNFSEQKQCYADTLTDAGCPGKPASPRVLCDKEQ